MDGAIREKNDGQHTNLSRKNRRNRKRRKTGWTKRINGPSLFGMMKQHHHFDDGRGRYPDRIQTAAPIGFRARVRRASEASGISSAAFIREAIETRLRQMSTPSNTAEA